MITNLPSKITKRNSFKQWKLFEIDISKIKNNHLLNVLTKVILKIANNKIKKQVEKRSQKYETSISKTYLHLQLDNHEMLATIFTNTISKSIIKT